jgi:methenyltetrahydromethanopterin cyclohydrolase
VTLSLNDRALQLADRLAADAEAARVEVTTLSDGTRIIDCGAQAPGCAHGDHRSTGGRLPGGAVRRLAA